MLFLEIVRLYAIFRIKRCLAYILCETISQKKYHYFIKYILMYQTPTTNRNVDIYTLWINHWCLFFFGFLHVTLSFIIGTTLNYFLDDKINKAEVLFPGVGCFLIAVFLGAAVHYSNAADVKAKLESLPSEYKAGTQYDVTHSPFLFPMFSKCVLY